jgi:hypothetical protein
MKGRGLVLAGVTALMLSGSGIVVASALNDLPQEAVPAQDPNSSTNRQPATPAPVEPAPEAAPAPASPVAVTPPSDPSIVIAAEDKAGESATDEEDPAEPVASRDEAPTSPSRRQRRRVAIVEAIDKITAESMRFEVEVGGRPVRFQKTLIFTARACEVSAGDEQVSDAVAYLEVTVQPRGVIQVNEPRQIFRGGMFASSPAINGLQHPIYDAWVVGCKA